MSMDTSQSSETANEVRDRARKLFSAAFGTVRRAYWAHADLVGFVTVAAWFLVVVVMAQLRPGYTWDSLMYFALSAREQFASVSDLHAYSYALHQATLPADQFAVLAQGDGFRARQFSDPEAFTSMFGLYEVKWLYIWLLKILSPLAGPFGAAQIINAAAMGILASAVGLWLKASRLSGYAPLVVAMFFLLQISTITASALPDFLANALIVAGILSLERRRHILGTMLVTLAVLTRPDQAAIAGVVMACAWLLKDRDLRYLIAAFVASIGAYLLVRAFAPGIGWWPHLWFSTFSMPDTLVGFHPEFSLSVYLTGFGYNLYRSLFENTWLAAYLIAIAWACALYASGTHERRRDVLLLAMLLVIPAKFVIFPLHVGRLYIGPLAVFFMLALAAQLEARGRERHMLTTRSAN